LNLRPHAPQTCALPGCATPRFRSAILHQVPAFCKPLIVLFCFFLLFPCFPTLFPSKILLLGTKNVHSFPSYPLPIATQYASISPNLPRSTQIGCAQLCWIGWSSGEKSNGKYFLCTVFFYKALFFNYLPCIPYLKSIS
jgi:hypothetical protein